MRRRHSGILSGAELTKYGAGVEDHEFRAGRILKLPFPDPGQWHIRVSRIVAEGFDEKGLPFSGVLRSPLPDRA